MVAGTVRVWHDELGWGVLDSPETPGGCWAHFSQLQVPGYHALTPGDPVTFTFEPAEQDGFAFRAVSVLPAGPGATDVSPPPVRGSTAYRTTLPLAPDDEADDGPGVPR